MSVFKRANWHSGLTYKQTCPSCKTEVEYTDEKLGFRPWFPDGFVYCPTCEKPLRHNEDYAINRDKQEEKQFCKECGKQLSKDDKFCSQCGTKV